MSTVLAADQAPDELEPVISRESNINRTPKKIAIITFKRVSILLA